MRRVVGNDPIHKHASNKETPSQKDWSSNKDMAEYNKSAILAILLILQLL